MKKKPLFKQGEDWTFDLLHKFNELGKKYIKELGFDYYPLQIEVISAEQMIGLYSSHAMPMHYNHWSIGKDYIQEYQNYYNGKSGLAYEICLNSNPCLCYCMENNDALEMASVIWHVYGHSSHFASNYLKRDGDAENIVSYMEYSRDYIAQCEEKYGVHEVSNFLDLAHSIQWNGINKFKRTKGISEEERNRLREEAIKESTTWYSAPNSAKPEYYDADNISSESYNLPEENIIFFIEKHSKKLTQWQRNILRIIRNLSQYSYSSLGQTSVMAEGTAMFVECYMMERAHQDGYISEGAYIQYLNMNGGVFYQIMAKHIPEEKAFNILMQHGKFNPYFLGYNIFKDIQRMCESPTDEDRNFRPEICGADYREVLKDVITNYRDESFIRQYLSPHLIKELQIMAVKYDADLEDDEGYPLNELLVTAHHEEKYYREIANKLADEYLIGEILPNVYISHVDSVIMDLMYEDVHDRDLLESDAKEVCTNISRLTGLQVRLYDTYGHKICSVYGV